MGFERIANIVLRRLIGRAVNAGVSAGIKAVAKRSPAKGGGRHTTGAPVGHRPGAPVKAEPDRNPDPQTEILTEAQVRAAADAKAERARIREIRQARRARRAGRDPS